jgi:hypothetical protein
MSGSDRFKPGDRVQVRDSADSPLFSEGVVRGSLDNGGDPGMSDLWQVVLTETDVLVTAPGKLMTRVDNNLPLPAPPGTGEVRAADPFPSLVHSLDHVPPRRDHGRGDGKV